VDRDNAEGSPRSVGELTTVQQSVLVGTLLGDGCLAKHGLHHRLHVKHAIRQRSLAEFKYAVFRDYISMAIHEFDQRVGVRRHPCVQFATRTSSIFSEWAFRFYQGGRKTIPAKIHSWMTPQALAVWLMDDGAADYAGVTLQTHSFNRNEVEHLAETLRSRFSLTVTTRANKGRRIIYVKACSVELLREIVEPYLLTEFSYKLEARRLRTP
jgi:hypothetical protein